MLPLPPPLWEPIFSLVWYAIAALLVAGGTWIAAGACMDPSRRRRGG